MRDLCVILIFLTIGVMLSPLQHDIAFNITFFGFIISLIGCNVCKFFKHNRLEGLAEKQILSNGIHVKEIKELKFSWKFLGRQFSTAQLVFSVFSTDNRTYWFVCGNWWIGCFSDTQKIYEFKNGELQELVTEDLERSGKPD